jgi:hypothetical protein
MQDDLLIDMLLQAAHGRDAASILAHIGGRGTPGSGALYQHLSDFHDLLAGGPGLGTDDLEDEYDDGYDDEGWDDESEVRTLLDL